MEIKLRNIYIIPDIGWSTTAFVADIYIDNVLAGGVGGTGRDTPTFYRGYFKEGCALIAKAEEWCLLSLPDTNLEIYIERLLIEYLAGKEKERFRNKLMKDCQDGIAVGIPDTEYRVVNFLPRIKDLVNSKDGITILEYRIRKYVLPTMQEGEKILNTNIPDSIIRAMRIDPEKLTVRDTRK